VSFAKYLKAAFLYHWNQLGFWGGLGFAAVSGAAGVFVPLVVAGELVYVTMLSSHPKFQKYVDAQEAKTRREKATTSSAAALQPVMSALPPKAVQRFEALRGRCLELRQIALGLKDPAQAGGPPPLEELQLAGLDRLLWTFLRLLFTQYMLERFFQRTNEGQIKRDIHSLEERLKSLAEGEDNPQKQKLRKAIEDNLETCRARLANLQKARENNELVQLEIDRLENKICSLSELAVNRQDPDFIVRQVDQVASDMVQTERTMNELQFATGLAADDSVPQLIQRQTVSAKQ
jgi:hypothetical protein